MPTAVYNSDMGFVWVLGFGNCIYDGCTKPTSHKIMPTDGEYLNAWKNYVRYIATEYKGKIDVYEVWNEPWSSTFNSEEASGGDYVNLIKATKEVLDEVDPDAKLMGGVVTNEYAFKWGLSQHTFLEQMLDAGGADYLDMISIHIYTQKFEEGEEGDCAYSKSQKTPEIAFCDWLEIFEGIFDKYNYTRDVWLDEAGWFDGASPSAVDRTTQAAYLIRQKVIWDNYLKTSNRNGEYIHYQLVDNSSNGFGVVDSAGNRKSAFYSAKAYNILAGDKEFEKLDITGNVYNATYKGENGDSVNIIWNTAGNSQYNVTLEKTITNIYNYKGEFIKSVPLSEGIVSIDIDETPVFIEGTYESSAIDGSVLVAYDAQNANITISGNMIGYDNGEQATVILYEKDADLISEATIAYVGQTMLDNNSFVHSFKVPEEGYGVYELMLGATNMKVPYVDTFDIYGENGCVAELVFSDMSVISATVEIRNYDSFDKNPVLIMCQYDGNGILTHAEAKSEKVVAGSGGLPALKEITATASLRDETSTVIAYVWDGIASLKPICKPMKLK